MHQEAVLINLTSAYQRSLDVSLVISNTNNCK